VILTPKKLFQKYHLNELKIKSNRKERLGDQGTEHSHPY
jgi:hypothetical protein